MIGTEIKTEIMKKICLAALLMVSMMAKAQSIGKVQFGTPLSEAKTEITAQMGNPSKATEQELCYTNKVFNGFKWNEIHFFFKDGKLNEARFYMNVKNKAAAKVQAKNVSKVLGKDNVMTEDYEDDGTPFYAGGKSPDGFGHLFTIFVSPRAGRWTTQLRYGPFELKH